MPGKVTRNIDGSVTATGDGVRAFQCLVMASGIKLWRMHKIRANRTFKIRDALRSAQVLTHRGPYTTGPKGLIKAEEDLKWRAEFIRKNLLD